MKWSAIVAMCAAPLALATFADVNAVLDSRTEHAMEKTEKSSEKSSEKSPEKSSEKGSSEGSQKVTVVQSTEIIIIWVNGGGGGTTTTVTSTVPGAPPAAGGAAPAAATHQVTVGGVGGLIYSPDQITAAVGDMVVFTFMSQNHTVTQSTFDLPCKKLAGGMDSGFMANPNNTIVPAPQMAMQVTVATPIWFYCRQSTHCGKGMVFSINPTAAKSHSTFQQAAIAQNGTGKPAAIVGGPPNAAPSAAPPAAAPPAAAPPAAAPPASPAAPAPAAAGTGLVAGTGTMVGGACACSCFCGTAAFPAAAIQGVAAFGGVAGAMPMSMMEKV